MSNEVVSSWAENKLPDIERTLENFRQNEVRQRRKKRMSRIDDFQPEKRWLSEMPICRALRSIRPPKGFRLVRDGHVVVLEEFHESPHDYFENPQTHEVVCLTAGQFVFPLDPDARPGDGISILQERATDMIRVLGGGIAIVCGPRDKLERYLGILYR
ncbi:hypothetical protein A2Y99_03585 [Candidatus Gottesmanbacteria bacterium RBG_13_37_7]|uniref:Uncharacterized protein n=1 Tax=Candidatus Gottesmanbacteria bacterium RBG_13_37_7 TaxID=1798369 RepID=A0A1F5YJ52_9BACT|nr:MAG: hypothetical protein A2Y99_03585 [Candidatus Gottesmanbacteria bacterium RBG_13_37_7]